MEAGGSLLIQCPFRWQFVIMNLLVMVEMEKLFMIGWAFHCFNYPG